DKEWYLYATRAGLIIGVANHRRVVSLNTIARREVRTIRPAPQLKTAQPPPPFSPIVVRATRWLADQQSLPTACAESHHARSPCARADHPLREPTSHPEAIRESQASYAIQVPRGVSPSKIPSAVLPFMPKTKAWPERPFRATHRGHRRDEAPQSEVRLCPHRPADRSRLWHRDRQRCRAPRACQTFSTRAGCRWSVLADTHRSREGQRLEGRSLPRCIHHFAQQLGDAGYGRLRASHQRVWHPPRMH